jgi:restriction system protein
MSLKMSDKSLFAVLLRSPWWVSFAVAIAVSVAAYNLFPERFANVGAVSGLPFVIIGAIAAWRQWLAPNPAHIDARLALLAAMPARDFALALEAGWMADGYGVSKIALNGADLSITKAGRTALVNSKRWKAATHGVEPLRELAASMATLDASQGIYVAANPLSESAAAYAAKNSIRVMQGTELALLLRNAKAAQKT